MAATSNPKAKAFISYFHEDRMHGAQVKKVLGEIGIDAFLAHDDIEVSDEWQGRIIEELWRCDLFVPLLSENFLSSKWAPQEAGFITAREGVVVFPLSIDGTMPFGFISKWQCGRIPKEGITLDLVVDPLARQMPRQVLPGLIQRTVDAKSFRSAEAAMRPLVPHFQEFTPDEAQALAEASVENGQVWDASLCRSEYLPAFVQAQGANIDQGTLRALQYQLEYGDWYRDEVAADA